MNNYWTAAGEVFDIGNTTYLAIVRLAAGEQPETAGCTKASSNGNGSLMRILPLAFYLFGKPIQERFTITKKVSSITHGTIRCAISCFYYLEFALKIIQGRNKFEIFRSLQLEVTQLLKNIDIDQTEIALFDRLLKFELSIVPEEEILSSGYVLHTLEASIWCLLTTDNFNDAVLKAVNLGEDADTTGAVTSGLAGLMYGIETIPAKWLAGIKRHDNIENLSERLAAQIDGSLAKDLPFQRHETSILQLFARLHFL